MVRYILNAILCFIYVVCADILVGPTAVADVFLVKPKLGAGLLHYNLSVVGQGYAGLGITHVTDNTVNDYRLLGHADHTGMSGLSLYWANEGFTGTKYKRIYRSPTYLKFSTFRSGDLAMGAGLKIQAMDIGAGYRANPYSRVDGLYLELTGGI